MTYSSLSRTIITAAVSIIGTASIFGAVIAPAPAEARERAVYYTAELAAPAQERTIIARGIVWQCDETQCIAEKNNSRPIIVCKQLARETGEITRFTAKGEALSAERLAKCND